MGFLHVEGAERTRRYWRFRGADVTLVSGVRESNSMSVRNGATSNPKRTFEMLKTERGIMIFPR